MADSQAEATETLETRFLTWHESAGSLHLRTEAMILFVDKAQGDLIEKSRRLRRHQPIRVTGHIEYSKTLSTMVFAVDTLEPA